MSSSVDVVLVNAYECVDAVAFVVDGLCSIKRNQANFLLNHIVATHRQWRIFKFVLTKSHWLVSNSVVDLISSTGQKNMLFCSVGLWYSNGKAITFSFLFLCLVPMA